MIESRANHEEETMKNSNRCAPGGPEIVFIDPNVSNLDQLLKGLRSDVEAIVLDPSRSAPAQISDRMQGRAGLKYIHVISHGRPGEVSFAAGALSLDTLDAHAADLAGVGHALAAGGGLMLWTCQTALGEQGSSFVQALSRVAGAAVAASSGYVGSAERGGRWELDSAFEVLPPLDAQGVRNYQGILSSISINEVAGDDIINASESQSTFQITGTTTGIADGHTVTVTLNGHTYTGSTSSGAWFVNVSAADLGALTDQSFYDISASVPDNSNHTVSSTHSVEVDRTADLAPALTLTASSGHVVCWACSVAWR
jgi:Domain of unknown function (DUF4347)